MAVPGLLFAKSKITSANLSPEAFAEWYNDVHIPDIFETSGIKTALRYESLIPSAERPYLALYPLEDLGFLQTDEFKAIPVHHESVPAPSHAIFDVADFDTRYYEHVQTYEGLGGKGTEPGPADIVIEAAATPVDDTDFDEWYRKEHCFEISKCPGYRRTRRYKLKYARQNRLPDKEKKLGEPPKYLALHEFDGDTLPQEQITKTAETEWSKRVWDPAEKEVGVYKLVKGFGDVKAKF